MNTNTSSAWRETVHRVIGELSRDAWLKANTTKAGHRSKRHRPYRLPAEAVGLVDALGADDKDRALRILGELLIA